jgi:hypothetical protein
VLVRYQQKSANDSHGYECRGRYRKRCQVRATGHATTSLGGAALSADGITVIASDDSASKP